ncbi:SPOR domain-containing protein [Halomonas sp. WWR20]
MKYGMRERISGAIILVALGAIFLPMLFDEPTPRGERPEPVLTIEQPIPVDRRPVAAPQPPASLSQDTPANRQPPQALSSGTESSEPPQVTAMPASPEPEPEPEPASEPTPAKPDPIAEIAQSKSTSSSPASASAPTVSSAPNGEWAVQVGSFGKADNAERLTQQLKEQGFPAYKQPRDNNLTTVYVGPFGSSEAGEQARTQLKSKANIQGLLIRIKEQG